MECGVAEMVPSSVCRDVGGCKLLRVVINSTMVVFAILNLVSINDPCNAIHFKFVQLN